MDGIDDDEDNDAKIDYDIISKVLRYDDHIIAQKFREYIIQNIHGSTSNIRLNNILNITSYSSKQTMKELELSLLIEKSIHKYTTIPVNISLLIAQFGMIATKIAYKSRADCVSFDKLEETFMIKAGGEKQCHLLTPCLLGADNLPFNVSFDVVFGIGSDRVVGKHGGVLLGIEYNKLHTVINRFTNKHGTVNIIDWIDRSIDRGYRVYEKSQDLNNRSSWNGKRVSGLYLLVNIGCLNINQLKNVNSLWTMNLSPDLNQFDAMDILDFINGVDQSLFVI